MKNLRSVKIIILLALLVSVINLIIIVFKLRENFNVRNFFIYLNQTNNVPKIEANLVISNFYLEKIEKIEFNEDLKSLFQVIYEHNGFFLIEYLEENLNFFSAIKLKLIFGLFLNENFDDLKIKLNQHKNCYLSVSYGLNASRTVLAGVYLDCPNFSVQISAFYKRNNFYWVAKGDKNFEYIGDVNRAFNFFDLKTINDTKYGKYKQPANVTKFFFDFKRSEFLECNRALFEANFKKYGPIYKSDQQKDLQIFHLVLNITSYLDEKLINYWISDGSMLGWYRDCGITSFANDFDLSIYYEQYTKEIKKHFRGHKHIWLWSEIGMVDKGYELRMTNGTFRFDLFIHYKHNSTHEWCAYQLARAQYKTYYYLMDRVCSAEILGYKISVPCFPEKYLLNSYGSNWMEPQASNYTYVNVDYTQLAFTDSEWLNAYRFYDQNGQIHFSDTIGVLQSNMKKPIMIGEIKEKD